MTPATKLKERALKMANGSLNFGECFEARQLLRDLVLEIEKLEKWRNKGQAFLRYYRKNNFDGCEALIDELDLLEQVEARTALSGGSDE